MHRVLKTRLPHRGLVEEEEAEERWSRRIACRQRRDERDGVGYVVAPQQTLGVPGPLPLLLGGAVVEPASMLMQALAQNIIGAASRSCVTCYVSRSQGALAVQSRQALVTSLYHGLTESSSYVYCPAPVL